MAICSGQLGFHPEGAESRKDEWEEGTPTCMFQNSDGVEERQWREGRSLWDGRLVRAALISPEGSETMEYQWGKINKPIWFRSLWSDASMSNQSGKIEASLGKFAQSSLRLQRTGKMGRLKKT